MLSFLLVAAFATIDPKATFEPSSCEDPVRRQAILDTDPSNLPILAEIKARSVDNERKMDELLSRLAERAKLSDDQKAQILLKMLQSPEFTAEFENGMAIMKKVMVGMEAVTNSKDPIKNCHSVVDMMGLMPAVDASAQGQWDVMRGVVEAEAKRLNVSLD